MKYTYFITVLILNECNTQQKFQHVILKSNKKIKSTTKDKTYKKILKVQRNIKDEFFPDDESIIILSLSKL